MKYCLNIFYYTFQCTQVSPAAVQRKIVWFSSTGRNLIIPVGKLEEDPFLHCPTSHLMNLIFYLCSGAYSDKEYIIGIHNTQELCMKTVYQDEYVTLVYKI